MPPLICPFRALVCSASQFPGRYHRAELSQAFSLQTKTRPERTIKFSPTATPWGDE